MHIFCVLLVVFANLASYLDNLGMGHIIRKPYFLFSFLCVLSLILISQGFFGENGLSFLTLGPYVLGL